MTETVILDGSPLTLLQVEAVARRSARVELAPQAAEGLTRARAIVERALADGRPHYGVTTGFGSLSRKRLAPEQLRQSQLNLIRSHAAGVGEPLPLETVRAVTLILAASLARGRSGVRPQIVEALVAMLNAGVHPVVPSVGSVGASGDLAPLAHLALVLVGEGAAFAGAGAVPGAEALRAAGIAPVTLEAKEGLALINGTHLMAAEAALLLSDFDRLFDAAVTATAMSIDACRASDEYLDPRVHAVRAHPESGAVAARLRELLAGSEILPSHRDDSDPRVQDPYSFRCAAYILGAASSLAGYVKLAAERELGAVTDNPLVFEGDPDRAIISAGNFHGMPIAIPLDAMAISVAHVAGVSERRVFTMLAAADPESHLTPYLAHKPGLQSGLMIAQYTAAACCNEITQLASPATVINLPTSAGMEDYNSFGPRSAAKLRRSLRLAENVIAIELLCAAEGLGFHAPLKSGAGVEQARALVRRRVPERTEDRPPAPDIEAVCGLIRAGAFALRR
ncbi:MAG: histidine ammonia-lyase [Phycisphaerales bacterium JB039]